MKHKFITNDDDWGIRKTVREIYAKYSNIAGTRNFEYGIDIAKNQIVFDVFYNQFVPPAWRETRSTVLRHIDEIKAIFKRKDYNPHYIWFTYKDMNGQHNMKCAILTDNLLQRIKSGEVALPTYIEIEEEKMKWQAAPTYNPEQGFSQPIREEFVQLRIHKTK